MKSKKLLCPAVFLIVAIFLIGTVASADTQTSNVFASFKEDTSPINPKLPGKIGGGKSDPEARFMSDLKWDTDKVTLEFPGSVIDTGNYSSTITWTLSGTPDV